MAVDSILRNSVSGISNAKIAYTLNLDENYIKGTLIEFLGFEGWEEDLDLNPWFVYRRAGGKESFEFEIKTLTKATKYDIIELMFNICERYARIRKEIDEHYK